MRKLIVQQWVTADNIAAVEDGGLSFVQVAPVGEPGDEDLAAVALRFIDTVDIMLQFKAVFGLTPHQYLTRIRMLLAVELMKAHSDHALQDIAWQIGFENASSFGRAFKSMLASSPGR